MPEIHLDNKQNILIVSDMPSGHGPVDFLPYPSDKAGAVIKEAADVLHDNPQSIEQKLKQGEAIEF